MLLLSYLTFSLVLKYAFLQHMLSHIHRVYSYYTSVVIPYTELAIYLYRLLIRDHTIHIHSCDTQTLQTAVRDTSLTVTYEIVLLVLLLEKAILIISVECPSCC